MFEMNDIKMRLKYLNGRNHKGNLCICRRIILKWILRCGV